MTQHIDGTTSAWFSLEDDAFEQGKPITLVTVQLDDGVDDVGLAFIETAERKALADWAKRGAVLMALVSHNGRELNLIVAGNEDHSRIRAEEFPSVASEMAQVNVRGVTALMLIGQRKFVAH